MLPHAIAAPCTLPAAAAAFARLAGRRGVFWLDSSAAPTPQSRYSILGAEPRWVFSARDDAWTLVHDNGAIDHGPSGALEQLDRLLDRNRAAPPSGGPELPFYGGAVGWLSYDLGRHFEPIPRRGIPIAGERRIGKPGATVEDPAASDIHLAWYDAAAVYDHIKSEAWLVGCGGHASDAIARLSAALMGPGVAPSQAAGAGSSHDQPATDEVLAHGVKPLLQRQDEVLPSAVLARSNLTAAEYMERVQTVREAIARGEFYQLNLVQRFTCALRDSPAQTYLRLRTVNPAPFAAFLATTDGAVLCSSPERFLEVSPAGAIRTCPIKGTRARGATADEDAAQRAELLASSKERAELLMIVDLLRNDLGRVCVPGSIAVRRLHALESFATVHHLVGDITGQLRPGVTRHELLRAVFPGGSITGAPKVSAMCAIEQLEPHRRGIAMGSIGYFSAHGQIDLNIAIRTIVAAAGVAYMSVGAGIVWDSDPAAEYAETLAKAQALFKALAATPA